MKGYIDRMSKAKVTDLKKHYPDLAPDKDYPPLKFKSLKGKVSAAEWQARIDCAIERPSSRPSSLRVSF